VRALAPAARLADAEHALREAAPALHVAFQEALPRAAAVVAGRLIGALYREDLAGVRGAEWRHDEVRLSTSDGAGWLPARRHAFDRVEVRVPDGGVELLTEVSDRVGSAHLAEELADAAVYLALGYARRVGADTALRTEADRYAARDLVALAATRDGDTQTVMFERLATEGHNLHPCGRTRLGWTVPDALAHDLEAGHTTVRFVAVRRDLHAGDDVGPLFGVTAPDPDRYAVQPVHPWQLSRVVTGRYADLVAERALVPMDGCRLGAEPTAALRTVLVAADTSGVRRYLKLSLDIQVTSSRRSISIASTRNGPALSALLCRLLGDDPAGGRLLPMREVAGAGARVGSGRDLGAIVREGVAGRLVPNEVAVPGGALAARSPLTGHTVLAELVARYAATRRLPDGPGAALSFVDEYARLLLPPLLRLAAGYGIALEAHLQNCVPTFRDGVPYRLALRDFAGLRLHRPRLAARGVRLDLWPGSVVGTDDADVMRAKLAYTSLQANLGEVVVRLADSHGLDEAAAWRRVRAVVDETYGDLYTDPAVPYAVRAAARADHAFLTAPTVPHKALVRMRLNGNGDVYVPVPNPLR
jgi:siderophore synthetase component